MAEPSRTQLSSSEWGARLNQILYQSRVTDDAPPMLAPKALVTANPEHYIPQLISLGPYHYQDFAVGGLEDDEMRKMSMNEAYKVNCAATLLNLIINDANTMEDMYAVIESKRPQFEHFYSWPQNALHCNYSQNFSLMMTLDSLFLLSFFLFRHERGEYGARINCDIIKLENQIPLFLLKEIFVKFELLRVLDLKDGITALLQKAYKKLSPFDVFINIPGDVPGVERQPHLLRCIHSIFSRFLQIKVDSPPPTLLQRICSFLDGMYGIFFCFFRPKEDEHPIKAYNAWELAKAGINFRSFSRPPNNIRFDKWSRTIYLPRMTISSLQTEILLRNLHALEFIDAARDNIVTSFIQLMDCLIDTPDDVQVLRKCHVISSRTVVSDKDITDIWESMSRPFYHDSVEPPKDLKHALDEVLSAKYYKVKMRSGFWELFHYYYEQYFSKPWSFIALLFGTFILAMNVVQAYCGLWVCNFQNSS